MSTLDLSIKNVRLGRPFQNDTPTADQCPTTAQKVKAGKGLMACAGLVDAHQPVGIYPHLGADQKVVGDPTGRYQHRPVDPAAQVERGPIISNASTSTHRPQA